MEDKSRITGYTELVGLFAYPIRHSNSPAMQTELFRKAGINCIQLAFEVDNSTLKDAVQAIRALKMRGANVSMPNKTVVGQYDGIGYMKALQEEVIDVRGQKMTVVGAGGAATAIQIQAAMDGVAEIAIFNVKDAFYAAGEETVRKINEQTNCHAAIYDLNDHEALRREIADSFLLANATGLGMKPYEGVTWLPNVSYLRPDLIVTDTVYAPPMTKLLEMAREVGCRTMNGHGMMVCQGEEAFRLWTENRVEG